MKRNLSLALVVIMILSMFNINTIYADDKAVDASIYENTQRLAKEKANILTGEYKDALGITSIQYALIDNGKIEVSGNSGVYSKTENKAITKDTMYGIGSVSKIYATVAVMKLVDQEKINLDTPIVNYINEFKMADERYKDITARMLLNHSSGLYGSTMKNMFVFGNSDKRYHDTFLSEIETQKLKADPGAFSVYCNDGFTLAEILVEEVSGMDFTSFIHENITKPLNLENTKTPVDEFDRNGLAKTYIPIVQGDMPTDTLNAIGAGGIYSTAEELCKFSQIFTDEKQNVLSKESAIATGNKEYLNGMWVSDVDNIIGFGLGWDAVNSYPFNKYGIKALVKGGDTIFYHSSLIVLPEHNMSVAVNSSGGSSGHNQMLATEILLQALKDKGIIDEIIEFEGFKVPVVSEMPEDMMKYSGVYGMTGNLIKYSIAKDGTMAMTYPLIPTLPATNFIYTKDGVFEEEKGGGYISFTTETNGKIYSAIGGYSAINKIGHLKSLSYTGQKLEPNEISGSVLEAWKERNGKYYYLLNDNFNSQAYVIGTYLAGSTIVDDALGYLGANKIINENEAVNILQIPGTGGRDTQDYKFYTQNGVEYLEAQGNVYMRHDAIKEIHSGVKSVCTIQDDGYARWYYGGVDTIGKKMTVKVPENASFIVYDKTLSIVNYSIMNDNNEVVLPEGSTMVFLGSAGAKFEITIQ